MRTPLIIIVLFLCFCNGPAFANKTQADAVVQCNHGYIYGTPAATAATAGTGTRYNPVMGLIHAVEKLDAWIRKNLW